MSVNVTAEKFDDTFTNTYEGQQIPSIKNQGLLRRILLFGMVKLW